MGLDAFVSCNCYKEGKTTPFPIPELEQYFGLSEEGHWEYLPPEDLIRDESYPEIYAWIIATGCEHEEMQLISERLANMSGYAAFRQALTKIGWHHFPCLQVELPLGNVGTMPVRSSELVLQELDYFQNEAQFGTVTSLFDSENGKVIGDYTEGFSGYYGLIGGMSNYRFFIDSNGFYIETSQKPRTTLFRAKRFEQRLLNEQSSSSQEAEFFDPETETRFRLPVRFTYAIPWPDGRWENGERKTNRAVPRLMHVAERVVGAEEYDYIVQPLIRLCKASVETGNPVVWS